MEKKMENETETGLYRGYMVVSKIRGPQYRPQYTIVLTIGTPQNGTPHFGKPPFGNVGGVRSMETYATTPFVLLCQAFGWKLTLPKP